MPDWVKGFFDFDEHPTIVAVARMFVGFTIVAILVVAVSGGGWPWAPDPSTVDGYWDQLPWLFGVWAAVEVGYLIYRTNDQ